MDYEYELQVAIEDKDFYQFVQLFELNDLGCHDYERSLLHSAATFGTLQMVKFLVSKGADVNRRCERDCYLALTDAADSGKVEIARFLIGVGSEIDISDAMQNPLMRAAQKGHRDVVEYLLSTSIDRHACYRIPDGTLINAFTEAQQSGNRKLVKLLKAEGCRKPVEGVDIPLWEPKQEISDGAPPIAKAGDFVDPVDRHLYLMMDALPFNIGFELDDLQIINIEKRHCAFEVDMTDAAMNMLNVQPPLQFDETLTRIEQTVVKLRNGETLKCAEAFPAATLGVLWGWQLINELNWVWCAVKQNGWETLAVCDPKRQYLILPVQYMRTIAGDTGRIDERNPQPVPKWPRDHITDIRNGSVPPVKAGSVVRIC